MAKTYALGRLPNDPSKPRVRLRRLSAAAIAPPPSADWLSKVTSWNVALNDQIGDCTCAGMGHIITQVEEYGQSKAVTIPDDDTLKMYEAISGYTPGKPNTDVGATLQDALGYARNNGLGGYKVVAFAQLDATDIDLVKLCIAEMGVVYTGFNFPESAMKQFKAGQGWSVVSGSPIEGGHCVPIGAYDDSTMTCVTWGATQKMTLSFYHKYFDEVWVPVFADWMQKGGTTPSGLDVAMANTDYQELTGDNQSPFSIAT
jgi:hypothetical protein